MIALEHSDKFVLLFELKREFTYTFLKIFFLVAIIKSKRKELLNEDQANQNALGFLERPQLSIDYYLPNANQSSLSQVPYSCQSLDKTHCLEV